MKLSAFNQCPIFAGIALSLVSQSGLAQIDITNFAAVGGNQTQQNVGVFIDAYLNDYNNQSPTITDQREQDLLDICNAYVTEAQGRDPNNALDVAEVLELYDLVSHEEVGAIGSGLTDTGHDQATSVLGRLQSLRAGTPAIASINNFGVGGAAGADFSKLSYFVNVSYGDGDKGRTRNEQGFDFDSKAFTLGTDYRFRDDIIAGIALGIGQSDVDIDNNLGGTESDTLSLTAYGTYYIEEWYVDWSFGYAKYDYDSARLLLDANLVSLLAGQTLRSSTDGDAFNWSIGGGMTQEIKGWNANYSLRLDGVDASIDGYTERGGSLALKVGKQEVESLQAVLGAQFSKAFSQDWGVISPYAGVEVHQEFDDETRVVTAQYVFDRFNNQFDFVSDDADDTYFVVSVGSSFVLAQGIQAFVNLDHLEGLDDVDSDTLTAGIRFEL